MSAFAWMHQSSSFTKPIARFSIASGSAGTPFSSKAVPTLGMGKSAGTVHARIFHSENWS